MIRFKRYVAEEEKKNLHPWEKAGLGKPPYRYLGVRENMYRPAPGVPAMPGGSCDYCGTGLRYEFMVQSADGKKFKVGSEHIQMVSSDRHLKRAADLDMKKLKKQKAKVSREKAREKLVSDVQHGKEILHHFPDLLKKAKHPSIDSKTMRDYVEFLLSNGGMAGKNKAIKIINLELQKEGLKAPKPGEVKIPKPKRVWARPSYKTKTTLGDIAKSTKKGAYRHIGYAEDEVELSKSGKAAKIRSFGGHDFWIPVSILKREEGTDIIQAPVWWIMQNRI